MNGMAGHPFSFDLAQVVDAVRQQFGLNEADVARAMGALIPTAFTGLKHTTAAPNAFQSFMSFLQGQGPSVMAEPFSAAPVPWFYGSDPLQKAVASQISAFTGVQQEAVAALMPVAATLALGNVARPFLQGQARDLLDAFMAGYARGRPKPMPGVAMMAGYGEAVQSFWSGFFGSAADAAGKAASFWGMPATGQGGSAQPAPAPAAPEAPARPAAAARKPGPAPAPESVPEPEVAAQAPAPGASIVEDWLSAGRAFQENHMKTIEGLFERFGPSALPGRA